MHTLKQPQLLQNSAEAAIINNPESDAPPKQVAQAMERFNQAARVIADIRLGADRILEAILVTSQPRKTTDIPLQVFLGEDASMRRHLQDLRLIGKKLEESGVLSEGLMSRSNSWGLHMPLVCPDGAVVAYAWKRQLAGQAGASAVDRTRLALKAFTDQKRRFFPQIDDGLKTEEPRSKKHRASNSELGREEPVDYKTLSEIQSHLEKLVANVKVSTYGRLNWLKRANSLPGSSSDDPTEASNSVFQSSSKLRSGLQNEEVVDKVAVIELSFPSVFRAIVSLNPAGSVEPDAVAFFSPDEGGSYLHARGVSVHHIYKHITEHAATVLQYFLGFGTGTALYSLLVWICSFESLFNKPCSKCGRLLAMDKKSALILPPLHHTYHELPHAVKTGEIDMYVFEAYHAGCSSPDDS